MKLKSMLLGSLFAGITAFSMSALAASDMDDTPAMNEATRNAPPEQSATKKMHSHMEERTGVPQKMPTAKAEKPKATPAADKHFHPRDGK